MTAAAFDEWLARGRVHRGEGRPADAIPCFRRAAREDPRSPLPHFHLGEVLWQLGLAGDAERAWQAASRPRQDILAAAARACRSRADAPRLRGRGGQRGTGVDVAPGDTRAQLTAIAARAAAGLVDVAEVAAAFAEQPETAASLPLPLLAALSERGVAIPAGVATRAFTPQDSEALRRLSLVANVSDAALAARFAETYCVLVASQRPATVPLLWPDRTAGARLRLAWLMPPPEVASFAAACQALDEVASSMSAQVVLVVLLQRRCRAYASRDRRARVAECPGDGAAGRRRSRRCQGRRRARLRRPRRRGGLDGARGAHAPDAPGAASPHARHRGPSARPADRRCRVRRHHRLSQASSRECTRRSAIAKERRPTRSPSVGMRRCACTQAGTSKARRPGTLGARGATTLCAGPPSRGRRRRRARPQVRRGAGLRRSDCRRAQVRGCAHRGRGGCRCAVELDRAQALVEDGLALDPRNVPLLRMRGRILLRRRDGAQAEPHSAISLTLDPADAETHLQPWRRAADAGPTPRTRRARISARSTFRPDLVAADFNLGVLFESRATATPRSRPSRTCSTRRSARTWWRTSNLGELLLAAGRVDEWLANFDALRAAVPERAVARRARARGVPDDGRLRARRSIPRRPAPRRVSRAATSDELADCAGGAAVPAAVLRRRAGDTCCASRRRTTRGAAASTARRCRVAGDAQAGPDARRVPVRRPAQSRDGQDDVAGDRAVTTARASTLRFYSTSRAARRVDRAVRGRGRRVRRRRRRGRASRRASASRPTTSTCSSTCRRTPRARPGILARKPARVQITHVASAGTVGLSAIDFKLTDALLRRAGEPGVHDRDAAADGGLRLSVSPRRAGADASVPRASARHCRRRGRHRRVRRRR